VLRMSVLCVIATLRNLLHLHLVEQYNLLTNI
jgi:hypothetical protein